MVHFEKCNDCCVWMDAGVLSYKRCDRNFDCEHCPLDSVLQSEIPDTVKQTAHHFEHVSAALPMNMTEDAAALLAPYASSILQRDFSYSDNHIWVQPLPGGYYRIGLDAFMLRLLPNATDVITLASGSSVPEMGPLGWIYLDGITHMLRCPVSGTIVRRNSSINRVNDSMRATPYTESWLAVLKADNEEDPLPHGCHPAAVAAAHIQKEMDLFLQRATEVLANPGPLGICLNDGGMRVASLELALGDRTYKEIIRSILHIGTE